VRLAIAFAALLAVPAHADPAAKAIAAVNQLNSAVATLESAKGGRDRVAALTQAIRAFEAGLSAMREGTREAAIREDQLTRQLAARDVEIAELIGAMQTVGGAPSPIMLLHPEGPTGSARAGMILGEITPSLARQAAELRVALQELQTLQTLQASAQDTLRDGLRGVQRARTELATAIADREPLPKRFTADPVRTAILISSTETLQGFAEGLSQMVDTPIEAATPDLAALRGTLPLPVQGRVTLNAGETDAAGVTRPGIVVATRPNALVTAPFAATVRYTGALLDLGQVIVLEPQTDVLLILSGVETVYVDAGFVVQKDAPLAVMGGVEPQEATNASLDTQGTGTNRSETLYIEIRENNAPVDPAQWFQTDKD